MCIFIGVIGVTLSFFSKKDVAIQEKAILSDNNNVIAFYRETEEGSGKYEEVEDIPEDGYMLNEEHTECNNGVTVKMENSEIILSNVSRSGTSCFLYFDVKKIGNPDETLAKLQLQKTGDLPSTGISTSACDDGTNSKEHNGGNCTSTDKGVYETVDDYGKSYVFRGTVDNNWVHFADMYWRIIRINGNGTIRLIYAGTTKPSEGKWGNTGDNAAIKEILFNDYYDDNKYVGYMYGGTGGSASQSYIDAHKNETESTIKKEIDNWYIGSSGIKEQYRDKIDVETGFCSDRQLSPEKHYSYLGAKDPTAGYGTTETAYAAYHRVALNGESYEYVYSLQRPTLKCGYDVEKGTTDKTAQKRDLFTGPDAKGTTDSEGNEISGNNALKTPVGLITSDEIIMAGCPEGSLSENTNYGYWLYTGANYWTITPFVFMENNMPCLFAVYSSGLLGMLDVANEPSGIRPVINIKSNVSITGKGTIESPYEIS